MKAALEPAPPREATTVPEALASTLLSRPAEARSTNRPLSIGPAAVMGTLAGFLEPRTPLVDFPGNHSGSPLPARSLVALKASDSGSEVALAFENGDPAKPLILGCVAASEPSISTDALQVSLDGEQVTFSAKNEIVLRCGKASITLTRAGKVLIRGAYLLSRSSGVNRIKGGSVQIN